MFRPIRALAMSLAIATCIGGSMARAQLTAAEKQPSVGDALADPGPLASDLSPALKPKAIQAAMRKVANWQMARIMRTPSQDWTFATLYVGLLAASDTLLDPQYRDIVHQIAEHYDWELGPRESHADDQAIGQAYLILNRQQAAPSHLGPLREHFDRLMSAPNVPAMPVWWWWDALFMAPPVWAQLSAKQIILPI